MVKISSDLKKIFFKLTHVTPRGFNTTFW